MRRGNSLLRFDQKLKSKYPVPQDSFCLVGIDEAGRGPWAGPVVASAVCLPQGFFDPDINDSKKLSPKMRLKLYKKIRRRARWAVGIAPVTMIDSINILRATHYAMRQALRNFVSQNPGIPPHLILIDGRPVPSLGYAQVSLIRGDQKSAAIAAASIMAKVTRDKIMRILHRLYPNYGLARHKGYGTALHQKRLLLLGASRIHRASFEPVRSVLSSSR